MGPVLCYFGQPKKLFMFFVKFTEAGPNAYALLAAFRINWDGTWRNSIYLDCLPNMNILSGQRLLPWYNVKLFWSANLMIQINSTNLEMPVKYNFEIRFTFIPQMIFVVLPRDWWYCFYAVAGVLIILHSRINYPSSSDA